MERYPVDGDNFGYAIGAISHRSWKKSDQIRLAKYYLKKVPFASARGYETFLSIMTIPKFINIISGYTPSDRSRASLLHYYIANPLQKKVKSGGDEKIVREFLDKLRRIVDKPE
jgi:hypothetical protein